MFQNSPPVFTATSSDKIDLLRPSNIAHRIDIDTIIVVLLCMTMNYLIHTSAFPVIRTINAASYLFFLPGYCVLKALYPQGLEFGKAIIWISSFGLSVVCSGLLLLASSYTVGLNVRTACVTLTFWNVSMIVIATFRAVQVNHCSNLCRGPKGKRILCLVRQFTYANLRPNRNWAIVILFSSFMWLIWTSNIHSPQFIEFYIVDVDNHGDEYSTSSSHGELETTIGLSNQAMSSVSYNLFYQVDQGGHNFLSHIVLEKKDVWQETFVHSVPQDTLRHKITYTLFEENTGEPYRSLYVWTK